MKKAGATTGKVSWLNTPCSSYMAADISQIKYSFLPVRKLMLPPVIMELEV